MEQATRCTPRRKPQERNRRAKRFQMIMNILPVAAELNLGVTLVHPQRPRARFDQGHPQRTLHCNRVRARFRFRRARRGVWLLRRARHRSASHRGRSPTRDCGQQSRKQRATPAVARIFDGEKEAKLIVLACSKPPKGRARWTLRLLEKKVVELHIVDRASDSTIGRALKKTFSSPIADSAGSSRRRPTARS
jgi:hypothetical protein